MGARFILTGLAYLAALALTGGLSFVGVLWLAGPHGGVLPDSMHSATLIAGWMLVLVIPILAARWAWRRLAPARRTGADLSLP